MSNPVQDAEERLALDLSRRKHFRLECSISAEYVDESGEKSGKLVIRNIGLGGARVDAPVEFPMPFSFLLKMPAQDSMAVPQPALDLQCHVAWTVADKAEGPYPTGIQFAPLDDRMRQRLFRYLACVMR